MKIALDVRRIRDFGVGTYIRNLVQAIAARKFSARVSSDLLGRGSAADSSAAGNFQLKIYNRRDSSRADHFGLPQLAVAATRGSYPHSVPPRAADDAATLRGYAARSQQLVLRRCDRDAACGPRIPSEARPGTGRAHHCRLRSDATGCGEPCASGRQPRPPDP